MTEGALPAAQKRFIEQFNNLDDTIVIVLKAHILIEELLDGIISTFVFHAEPLDEARLSFAQKLHLARAMSLREQDNSMWKIGVSYNSQRNDLAHNLDSPKRVAKILALQNLYREEEKGNPEALKVLEEGEQFALMMIGVYFLGFLATFRDEVGRFRRVVDAMDNAMNGPVTAA
ncbi:MAG: hypothetical protein J0I80_06250 [Sphingomonas sp.]|nr:hypothetical protein [Sphingomonas sp.]